MKRLLIEEIEKLDRNFLTPAEAAAAMEISLSTFYRNREKMNLPTVRSGRKIHIPKDAFLEFLRCGKSGDERRGTPAGDSLIVYCKLIVDSTVPKFVPKR